MKRLTVLALLLLTAACSSKPEDPAPAPTGQDVNKPSTPGDATNKPADKPGTTNEAGDKPADKPAEPAPVLKNGTITLTQTTMKIAGTTTTSYTGSASFIDATHAVIPDGATAMKCTKSTESGCGITDCDLPEASNDPPPTTPPPTNPGPTPKLPSAGDITVEALQKFTLSPDGNGFYGGKTGTTTLMSAGKDVKVSASGAEIPTFDKTFKAPSQISVTQPAWPAAGAPLEIDRSKDFSLEWSDAHTGEVGVTLSAITKEKMVTMICNYKITDGKATIAAATLGKLPTGGTSSISVETHTSDALDVDGWHIQTTAKRPGQVDGMMAASKITLK